MNHFNEFTVVKRTGNPFNLFEAKEFDDALNTKGHKVLIGHNRFATIGDKSEINAHPFQFEHILGAHNGTLDKYCLKDLHESTKFETDSEALFSSINHIGIEATMKLVTGAWALTWFDNRTNTLNFLRNDKRPLYYCYSEDRCTLIWASEFEMIKYVLSRRNKKIQNKNNNEGFFLPSKNILYSWKIPKSINQKFEAPDQLKIEEKVETFFKGDYSSYWENLPDYKSVTKIKIENTNIVPFVQRHNTAKKFRPPYKDKHGRVINKPQLHALTTEGCAFCNSNGQQYGEFIHILGPYYGPLTPYMCENCYNDKEAYEIASYSI